MEELLAAWTARDWYAFAVLAIVGLMQLLTKTAAWSRWPRSLQWLPPVLLGASAGLAEAYYEGLAWQTAVVHAIGAGLQIGLGAVGLYHAGKRLGSPSTGAVVALLLACTLPLTSCSAFEGRPAAHYIETSAALAYSSAVVAFELLDAQEAARIAALESPTAPELEAAETRVRRLELVRDSLSLARDYLSGGKPTDDLRGPLSDAVGLLRAGAEELGRDCPSRVLEALRVADLWLGGES